MQLHKNKKRTPVGKAVFLTFLVLVILGLVVGFIVFFEKEKPLVNLDENLKFLGKSSHFSFDVKDLRSGIRSIQVSINQADKAVTLFEKQYPRMNYYGKMGPASEAQDVLFDYKKSGLKNGEAEIIITANDFSLRGYLSGNQTEFRKTVTIDTQPPKLRLIHAERYISPGGSGIVIYQNSDTTSRHGVIFAQNFHKGHLIGDGRDDVFIAYIGLPYNAKEIGLSKITAKDDAGNESSVSISPAFKKAKLKRDRINVSNGFLESKIPEFEQHYPEISGDMKEKYLYINNTVRKNNNKMISDLCQNAISERLWTDNFVRMAGASRAGYADHRTYYYNDKEIDKQVHLGMDIASTKRANVKAANKGKVVYADYLGIYGNMVILDHGQGVFSLYSHLSQIQVAVDDVAEKSAVIGQTGKSGMAGGDHLHFSMLINGIFVTPKEWWDPQWIEVTINEPISDSRF